jgi:hypothetical protein
MQHKIVEKLKPLMRRIRGANLGTSILSEYIRSVIVPTAIQFLQSSLYFKHKSYINEEEYRLIQIHLGIQVPDLKYRRRPYSLVRYREFDWRAVVPAAIKRIIIGPAADERRASQFIRDCLRAFDPAALNTIEISKSEIPYRAP